MRRVLVVITARPSYSRVKSVLTALKARADVQLQVVACASAVVTRYSRIVDQIKADGFPVVAEVSSVVEEDSLANSALSTGVLLTQLAGTLERLRPDVVVTIADRHETLATAIAASYQHIPLCHIQGGEVTGSIDDKVRNAVTQLADIHCVSTELAGDRVFRLQMHARGENCYYDSARQDAEQIRRSVYVTGCPSIDLATRLPKPAPPWTSGVIVLQHPVTGEYDMAGEQMEATLDAISTVHGRPVTVFWPGEDAGASRMAKVIRMANVEAVRNEPPMKFLERLSYADCLVGNSSVGIREGSFLGVPVVNVGSRQQGRERAQNVIDVPHDAKAIRDAIQRQLELGRYESSTLYGDGHAGERIASILTGEAKEAAA